MACVVRIIIEKQTYKETDSRLNATCAQQYRDKISPKMGEVCDAIGLDSEWNQLCKRLIVKRHENGLKSITSTNL